MLGRLGSGIVDLLFPPRCVGCGRVDTRLCPDCCDIIQWVSPPCCPTCARSLAFLVDQHRPTEGPLICPACAEYPLGIDGIQAATVFGGVIRKAIHAFKYKGRTDLADTLADLMFQAWREHPLPADCILPVPLHPLRERHRGYNQAVLLAQALAKRTELLLMVGVLERRRPTEPQIELGILDRRRNVDGAFVASSEQIDHRSVLLIDDVCTTGSTLAACAQALKDAGAKAVYALTLARADLDPITGLAQDSDQS